MHWTEDLLTARQAAPTFTYVREGARVSAVERAKEQTHAQERALARAAELARVWTRADHGVVCLVDDAMVRPVACSSASHAARARPAFEAPLAQSLCARVVEFGVPVAVNAAGAKAIADATRPTVGSYLGMPVEVLGQRVGNVSVVHHEQRTWSVQDEGALRELARVVEQALTPTDPDHAPAGSGADRLPLSGVLRIDEQLRITAAEGLYEVDGDHAVDLLDVIDPERWPHISGYIERVQAGEAVRLTHRTSLGRYAVELHPDAGGFLATYRLVDQDGREPNDDVTRLLAPAEVDDALLELVSDGVVISDADGVILRRNARARTFEPSPGIERLSDWREQALVLDADGRWLAPEEHPTALALRSGFSQIGVELIVVTAAGRRRMRVSAILLQGERAEAGAALVTVLQDVSELHDARMARSRASSLDHLTGLLTRPALERRLRDSLMLARARRRHLALLLFDIDDITWLNDLLGTQGGDELIRLCAHRLEQAAPDTLLARVGGDEFALVTEVDDDHHAVDLARRLRAAVQQDALVGETTHRPAVHIGLAVARAGAPEGPLLSDAELALSDAKHGDGTPIVLCSTERRQRQQARRRTERDLRTALHAGGGTDLELHFQPLFDAQDGTITDLEALVRWHHPTRGPVPPGEFIPIAEQFGLIADLGDWVLGEACRQAAAWRAMLGPRTPRLHVNLAASQFADQTLPMRLLELLDRHELPACALGVEVTESQIMHSDRPLRRLRAMDVQVSLDDFGTGFSSLSRLQDLPIDTLKVDRAFVSGPTALTGQHALLSSIVTMGRGLGLQIVAEGVETEQQAQRARELGCHRLQGFHLGRPAPADAWTDALLRAR